VGAGGHGGGLGRGVRGADEEEEKPSLASARNISCN
jgi:hypothetical protein